MAIHRDLLHQARRLARLDSSRPRQANLRRAVSSAYYALFHFLTDQASRVMLGGQHSQVPYRQVIARGFDHGTMKDACRSFSGGNLPQAIVQRLPPGFALPITLQVGARTFVELQEQRHSADYDLSLNFTRANVLSLVQQAEQAFAHFNALPDRTLKKFFLSCLWAWKGINRR